MYVEAGEHGCKGVGEVKEVLFGEVPWKTRNVLRVERLVVWVFAKEAIDLLHYLEVGSGRSGKPRFFQSLELGLIAFELGLRRSAIESFEGSFGIRKSILRPFLTATAYEISESLG